MIPLFAYGTLRDAEFLNELFGRVPERVDATLAGWRVVVAEGGYYSVVPDAAHAVSGTLVFLDERELALADRWEEVPLYQRRVVAATDAAAGAPVTCWVYVRPTESRTPPPPGVPALHDRGVVLATIRDVRERARSAPSS